jgi:hypothetical protein
MTQAPDGPPRGQSADGPGDVCFDDGRDIPDKAQALKNQAKILRLVRPPRPRRIDVMITARDGPAPIGGTRPLRLTQDDLDELIAVALGMEGRR